MGMYALKGSRPNGSRQLALGLALFLSMLLAMLLGTRAFAAEQATAVLARVSGTPIVYELSAGKPRQVSSVAQGKQYRLPIEIETGTNDSATFALVNSVIEISPNSLMRIVAPENRDVGVVQRVLQQAGSSLFRVHRGTMDRFQVETPFLVSVVKGTVFNVLVRDDGATVSLQEGRLQVNSLDARQTVDLAPGDVAFAGRDGALKMLKVEVTDAGARTRETVATRTDSGDAVADATHGIVRDVVPPSGVPPSGVVGGAPFVATSPTAPVVATVSATVSPVVAGVAVPVANVVEPVTDNLVAPVVSNVVAPVVNTVVSNVVAPTVNTVVAPVMTTVVAPVIDGAVSPVVSTVVAPVVATVVAPVTNTVVAPVANTVVAPVAPVVAPVATAVVAPVVPVVAPVVAVVTPVVAPVVTPIVPVVAPVAPVVAPITGLLGLHH